MYTSYFALVFWKNLINKQECVHEEIVKKKTQHPDADKVKTYKKKTEHTIDRNKKIRQVTHEK